MCSGDGYEIVVLFPEEVAMMLLLSLDFQEYELKVAFLSDLCIQLLKKHISECLDDYVARIGGSRNVDVMQAIFEGVK